MGDERRISKVTDVDSGPVTISATNSNGVSMTLTESTETIWSPGSNPAAWAGDPGNTLVMSTCSDLLATKTPIPT